MLTFSSLNNTNVKDKARKIRSILEGNKELEYNIGILYLRLESKLNQQKNCKYFRFFLMITLGENCLM